MSVCRFATDRFPGTLRVKAFLDRHFCAEAATMFRDLAIARGSSLLCNSVSVDSIRGAQSRLPIKAPCFRGFAHRSLLLRNPARSGMAAPRLLAAPAACVFLWCFATQLSADSRGLTEPSFFAATAACILLQCFAMQPIFSDRCGVAASRFPWRTAFQRLQITAVELHHAIFAAKVLCQR